MNVKQQIKIPIKLFTETKERTKEKKTLMNTLRFYNNQQYKRKMHLNTKIPLSVSERDFIIKILPTYIKKKVM